MDVLLIDGLLHDFPHAEGGVPAGIEILGGDMERALLPSPGLHILNLNKQDDTTLFFSVSATLTMCPKEGTTLMLILLRERSVTRLKRWCSGMTYYQLLIIVLNKIIGSSYF